MSDVRDDHFDAQLNDSSSSSPGLEPAAPFGEGIGDSVEAQAASRDVAHDDEWHVVDHPSADQASHLDRLADDNDSVREGEPGADNNAVAPGSEAGSELAAADASCANSQHSGHSFEHLSDHFGSSSTASMTSSFGSSFDGLAASASVDGDAEHVTSEPPATAEAASEIASVGSDAEIGPHVVAAAMVERPQSPLVETLASLPPLAEGAAEEDYSPESVEEHPAVTVALVEPAAEENGEDAVSGEMSAAVSLSGSGSQSHIGSSYADLGVGVAEEQTLTEAAPSEDALVALAIPVEGTRSEAVEDAVSSIGSVVDGAKDREGALKGVLRAAIACLTAAPGIVWIWTKEHIEWLVSVGGPYISFTTFSSYESMEAWARSLGSRASHLSLRARHFGSRVSAHRSSLLLGASGVTVAVLGTLLYTTRQQNLRLRGSVVERDQDLACLMSRIFQLREALRPTHIPILHHVSAGSAGISVFPSSASLVFL